MATLGRTRLTGARRTNGWRTRNRGGRLDHRYLAAMTGTETAIFTVVVGTRLLVPLLIFRFPLPAILACLVVDGLDQTIFQTFTSIDLTDYQSYDKALDTTTCPGLHLDAAQLDETVRGQDRPVPAVLPARRRVLFELTDQRWLLMVFPNTFEYFFIAYETVRMPLNR